MEEKTFTVSEINSYINRKMKLDSKLKNIYIEGEVSDLSYASSGHTYFTLKDEKSQIPAMLSEFNRKRFNAIAIDNGMKIIVKGKIEVYEKDGKYQLYATKIYEDGEGNKHKKVEELKERLNREGLFDPSHKKEIPKYPKRIGVVTAPKGAAIRDIITTIQKRYPFCEILVFPTLVQGDSAPKQIAEQIENAENFNLDTLIVGRGGGSFEDLMAFNEEIVVRAIYSCSIPVISAVGHEINHSISDLVADSRAPTPTAAGNFAVPDFREIKSNINHLGEKAKRNMKDRVGLYKTRLQNVCEKQIVKNPQSIYELKAMHLDSLVNKMNLTSQNMIHENRNRLFQLENSFILKNPTLITKRKKDAFHKNRANLIFSSQNMIRENRNRLFQLENSFILKNPTLITKRKREDMQEEKTVNKLRFAAEKIIMDHKKDLMRVENSFILKNPQEIIEKKKERYYKNINKLEVLNPLLTLKRGYSIAKTKDKVITSAKDVEKGDQVDIELEDGVINTKVI